MGLLLPGEGHLGTRGPGIEALFYMCSGDEGRIPHYGLYCNTGHVALYECYPNLGVIKQGACTSSPSALGVGGAFTEAGEHNTGSGRNTRSAAKPQVTASERAKETAEAASVLGPVH